MPAHPDRRWYVWPPWGVTRDWNVGVTGPRALAPTGSQRRVAARPTPAASPRRGRGQRCGGIDACDCSAPRAMLPWAPCWQRHTRPGHAGRGRSSATPAHARRRWSIPTPSSPPPNWPSWSRSNPQHAGVGDQGPGQPGSALVKYGPLRGPTDVIVDMSQSPARCGHVGRMGDDDRERRRSTVSVTKPLSRGTEYQAGRGHAAMINPEYEYLDWRQVVTPASGRR